MKFYINKYPMFDYFDGDKQENVCLPVGTVFRIESINGDFFHLKTVNKPNPKSKAIYYMVGPVMLAAAFTETEFIEAKEKG